MKGFSLVVDWRLHLLVRLLYSVWNAMSADQVQRLGKENIDVIGVLRTCRLWYRIKIECERSSTTAEYVARHTYLSNSEGLQIALRITLFDQLGDQLIGCHLQIAQSFVDSVFPLNSASRPHPTCEMCLDICPRPAFSIRPEHFIKVCSCTRIFRHKVEPHSFECLWWERVVHRPERLSKRLEDGRELFDNIPIEMIKTASMEGDFRLRTLGKSCIKPQVGIREEDTFRRRRKGGKQAITVRSVDYLCYYWRKLIVKNHVIIGQANLGWNMRYYWGGPMSY